MGNLVFSKKTEYPDINSSVLSEPIQWNDLLEAVELFEKTRQMNTLYRDILKNGSTQGSARPKLSMMRDGECYLVKLPSVRDINNLCQIEHGTMKLAEAVGINVAKSELLKTTPERDIFITKRFDVQADKKTPYLSMRSTLNVDHPSDASYASLAEELTRINGGMDSLELFDRMIFNLAVTNHDDHFLNHAVYYSGHAWRLTPAFDIVAGEGSKTHAITLGKEGNKPSIDNALSMCESFGLSGDRALERAMHIVTFIAENWKEIFSEAGVDENVIRTIGWAMLYDVKPDDLAKAKDRRVSIKP